MSQLYWVKIKSASDIITNSSSEVFVIKNNDTLSSIIENFKVFQVNVFDTEENLKEYVMRLYKYDCIDELDVCLTVNPLTEITYSYMTEMVEKTPDEIWEFFKNCYIPLLGYVMFTFDNENNQCDENYYKEYSIIQRMID